MATRARSIQLTEASFRLLEQEARRRGTQPDAIAEQLLRDDLSGDSNETLDITLAELAELRTTLPEIDGLALARDARRDLQSHTA